MEKKKFKEHLTAEGLKLTKERGEILQEVLAAKGHFAPDDLFVIMKSKGSKVSRASVYRTLPLLVESGIIDEVERVDKHAHYERVAKSRHHDHMICTGCGAVIEFYSKELEELQERLCRLKKFTGMRHCLEIMGTCGSCKG